MTPVGPRLSHPTTYSPVSYTHLDVYKRQQQILARPAQIDAVLRLVRELQARYGIGAGDVIGHAMANGHRLFVDKLGWRNDHTDWSAASIAVLRQRL